MPQKETDVARRYFLAPNDDQPHAPALLDRGRRAHEMPEYRRCRMIDSDALSGDPATKGVDSRLANVVQMQTRAVEERSKHVHHRRIAAVGGQQAQLVVSGDLQIVRIGA